MLHRRYILIFVDDEVPVLFSNLPCDIWAVAHDANQNDDDVLEVDHGAIGLHFFVDLDEVRNFRMRIVGYMGATFGLRTHDVIVRRDQ